MIRRTVRFLDERTGTAPLLRKTLRYVFPDHWSFLLGEVALYAFVVLVATGIYLTLFFDPSTAPTYYHGSYAPLHGAEMTHAYRSVLDISFKVKAGLLIRQTHHWRRTSSSSRSSCTCCGSSSRARSGSRAT